MYNKTLIIKSDNGIVINPDSIKVYNPLYKEYGYVRAMRGESIVCLTDKLSIEECERVVDVIGNKIIDLVTGTYGDFLIIDMNDLMNSAVGGCPNKDEKNGK